MRMASYMRAHHWMRSFQKAKTAGRLPSPVIEGIAPELAVGGEGVGGDPGHRSQAAVLIQLKQLRVVVHLGAVGGQIEGDVPHDADVLLVGVLFQVEPLAVEGVLEEGVEGHPVRVGLGVLRPLVRAALIPVVEGGKLGVLPDPGQVVLLRGGLHEGEGAPEGQLQQVHPGLMEKGVVHPGRGRPDGRSPAPAG